jgi:1,4-dihydroxy-2-naphthoyl-CoA hydrolase
MNIWRRRPTVEALNELAKKTLLEQLDIRFTAVGDDCLVATMPVDHRTHQPFGLLHGGASASLAETLGSAAANCCLDTAREYAVGVEINANHLRAVSGGRVTGTARPLHIGRRTQVWETRVEDEAGRLVCVSRLTLAVVPRETS